MSGNLAQTIKLVFGSEGGFSNDPRDNGGPTKYGITAKTLGATRRLGRAATVAEVKALKLEEAARILDQQYARPIRFEDLPAGLDYAVFDFGVNSGPAKAARVLQGLLGVPADGIIGEQTLAKIRTRETADLINRLQDARLAFLKTLDDWRHFKNGWTTRVAHVRRQALKLAGGVSAVGEPPTTAGQADPSKVKVSKTAVGQGTITTTIGTAGAAIGAAKDTIEPLTGSSWLIDNLFTVLTVGGLAVALVGAGIVAYGQLRQISQGAA